MHRVPRHRPVLALILALLATGACGGDSGPAGPEETFPDVSGTWTGTAEDTFGTSQTVQLLVTQDEGRLTGSIVSQIFRTDFGYPFSGTLTPGGAVTLQVLAADRGGCFDVTINLQLSSSQRLLPGSYVINRKADGCGRQPAGPPPSRPFSLTRGRTQVGNP